MLALLSFGKDNFRTVGTGPFSYYRRGRPLGKRSWCWGRPIQFLGVIRSIAVKIGIAQVVVTAVYIVKPGIVEVGTAGDGTAEIRTAEVGIAEVGSTEVRTAEVCIANVGTAKVRTVEIGTAQVGATQVRLAEVNHLEDLAMQFGATEIAFFVFFKGFQVLEGLFFESVRLRDVDNDKQQANQ